jgi:uncharacterized protein YkwD
MRSVCAGVIGLSGAACDPNLATPFGDVLGLGSATCEPVADATEQAETMLRLVNEARVTLGSFPLTMDPDLAELADDWACTMIEDRFFDHDHPDGETFAERWETSAFGVCYFGGENLAARYDSPEEVFQAWYESKGHREEMLFDGFTHMGLAVRSDGHDLYWVQEFRGGGCDLEAPQLDPITVPPAQRPPLPNERAVPDKPVTSSPQEPVPQPQAE